MQLLGFEGEKQDGLGRLVVPVYGGRQIICFIDKGTYIGVHLGGHIEDKDIIIFTAKVHEFIRNYRERIDANI